MNHDVSNRTIHRESLDGTSSIYSSISSTAPQKQAERRDVCVDISDPEQGKTLRLRGATSENDRLPLSSAIKPFPKRSYTLMKKVTKEFKTVLAEKQGWRIFWFLVLNLACTLGVFIYSASTNSLVLMAFGYLTVFDLSSLLTCLLSIWVSLQKPSAAFSYGYERYEVLAVFSTTILAMFGALFVFKESTERLMMPPEIYVDSLLPVTLVGLIMHLLVTYGVTNKPLMQVSKAASSNWLQDAVCDLGHSICGFAPFIGKILVQKFNPIALVGIAGTILVIITEAVIDYNKSYLADSVCAILMTCIIWATMLPLSMCSGRVLLQTCPVDVMTQIDKCLREASTMDGVLEFRNEHFWTVSFGKLAGSLHVRIRRDANEQMVLAHVTNKLASHVTYLTVQVFKDDWLRSSSSTKMTNIAGSPLLYSPPGFPRVNQPSAASRTYANPHSHSHAHGHGHAHGRGHAQDVTAAVAGRGHDRSRPSQKAYAGPPS